MPIDTWGRKRNSFRSIPARFSTRLGGGRRWEEAVGGGLINPIRLALDLIVVIGAKIGCEIDDPPLSSPNTWRQIRWRLIRNGLNR